MLDTDMASYVIKDRSPEVAARLAEIPPSMVCVSVMTRAELIYGLKRLPEGHRLQLGVRQFLRLVRVLAWDSEAADYYAEIRHQVLASGQPIGELDMMIAAHSLSVRAVLVTNNTRDYARIAVPLTVVKWTGRYDAYGEGL